MNRKLSVILVIFFAIVLLPSTQLMAQDSPSTDEHIASLQAMCSDSSEMRAERHNQKPLYERLGGYDKIYALTQEIVRLHLINDSIKHMFTDVNLDMLIKHVADFVSAGSGGKVEYKGRNMLASHVHLKITNEDFLSAAGDIVKAMKNMGHGQNEIDEMVCILLSLKDQIVVK